MDAVDRRNSDFFEISKRLSFGFGSQKGKDEYREHVMDYPWIPRLSDSEELKKALGINSELSIYDAEWVSKHTAIFNGIQLTRILETVI